MNPLSAHAGAASPSTFYIDESGQGGDLVSAGPSLDFKEQPVFVLAVIGSDDEPALTDAVDAVRRRRFPQAAELKASAGHANPAVISDLLDALARLNAPILIEVMDKRFTLASTIINTLVLRPLGPSDREPQALWFRAQLAEYLHDEGPTAVYDAYLHACRAPSESSLKSAFRAVLDWIPPSTPHATAGGALRFFTLDSLKDFRKEGARRPEAQRRFLPLPDVGHTGKLVWILPHLSAFTNVYARINRLREGCLEGVCLVHDEQRYYADILTSAKATAEDLASYGQVPVLERADYQFTESGELIFEASHGSAGLQAADLLAGFAMRHVRDVLAGCNPTTAAVEAFRRLADGHEAPGILGVNFMLSNRDILRCGLIPSRDPAISPARC